MPLIKYNNQSLSSLTALPAAIPTGKLKLISSQTASNSASISFTSGLNSTYKVYKFVFVNCHPRTDAVDFRFNLSTDSGSNYNVTKTTTNFSAYQNESDAGAGLAYDTNRDLAQSTSDQVLNSNGLVGNGADESLSGSLTLFNPASTVYVKHFISRNDYYDRTNAQIDCHVAGYANTTSAVNAIIFRMSSGNFDGTIYLYAIDNS
jgi:hypothetical protein